MVTTWLFAHAHRIQKWRTTERQLLKCLVFTWWYPLVKVMKILWYRNAADSRWNYSEYLKVKMNTTHGQLRCCEWWWQACCALILRAFAVKSILLVKPTDIVRFQKWIIIDHPYSSVEIARLKKKKEERRWTIWQLTNSSLVLPRWLLATLTVFMVMEHSSMKVRYPQSLTTAVLAVFQGSVCALYTTYTTRWSSYTAVSQSR